MRSSDRWPSDEDSPGLPVPGHWIEVKIMTIPVDYGDMDWLLERLSTFHKEYRHVEREYLEIRTLLRDAEADLRANPSAEDLRQRVYYLQRRVEVLEQKYPWLASGKAPEIAFWAPPAG